VGVKAGEQVSRLPEVLDLCQACGALLVSYVQGGKPQQAHQDVAGAAPGRSAVASKSVAGKSV
jgi:hypothetical protein